MNASTKAETMHATLTNLERGQLNELETRLVGYRRLCDAASTREDMLRGIMNCKELVRQINELQARIAYRKLYESGALVCMLPWLVRHVEETRALMGEDFWPYGLERNTHTLETFLRYSFEQGLAKRMLKPAELFTPESLESFVV